MDKIINTYADILDSANDEYDVSVCIITYNKRQYIKDTIESVLRQNTTCRYEIVIGDNASTDGTYEILKEYWERSNEKFCIIRNKENLGLTANMFNTMAKAKGKYIIILYGDDYWTDNNKMQKQYDYLEKNKELLAVTTPVDFVYDGENVPFRNSTPRCLWDSSITLQKYLRGYDFPLAGTMFRNKVFSDKLDYFDLMNQCSHDIDDASFCILLLMCGDVYIYPKAMGVYRCFRKNSGANNFNSLNPIKERCKKHILLFNNLSRLTEGTLNLETRYGLILASAFNGLLHREINKSDFKYLIDNMDGKYKRIWCLCLVRGLCKKVELKIKR